MTVRQLFEYSLIELNKVKAPSLILEDYNYFINKAVGQYINKMYNLYDVNQQKSDDLRVLKSTAALTPIQATDYGTSGLFSKVYEVDLPNDYLHILNCVVEYDVNKNFKCYDKGDKIHFGAIRLTADMFSQIINNFYMRPEYKRPYFYINNVNQNEVTLTDPVRKTDTYVMNNVVDKNYIISINNDDLLYHKSIITIVDLESKEITFKCKKEHTLDNIIEVIGGNSSTINIYPNPDNLRDILIEESSIKTIKVIGPGLSLKTTPSNEKIEKSRISNKTKVRMEIRYGKDNSIMKLSQVYIDYLKSPQFLRLTQEQIDEIEDNSQMLEFPDYVCQEIVNELIKLLMENSSDQRIQSHIPINQTIANPAQEQQK